MFFVLKFELILIIGSNNVITEGAALDRAGLETRIHSDQVDRFWVVGQSSAEENVSSEAKDN
jgi:hypothetical protein